MGMTTDDKLAAILAAVQTDPGGRGLARDPDDNLFTATTGDFQTACVSLTAAIGLNVHVVTGFFIPAATPPAFETDGPLGTLFLVRALSHFGSASFLGEPVLTTTMTRGARFVGFEPNQVDSPTHFVAIERGGPSADGRRYTMRGRDITGHLDPNLDNFPVGAVTIGIGDGGNEVGMGRVPHDTVVRNIPNGDRIHCRVPTDHLIVAGVSNWGAYALAAGVFALKGETPPNGLFDPECERRILEVMIREGPLVDGVTGQQAATVDGLSWEEYARPLIRIREILES